MKDIVDAINSRVKEPYFGYAFLSFLAINWKAIFLLIYSKGSAEAKIIAFEGTTTTFSLVVYPLLIAALMVGISPWLRLVVSYISNRAIEIQNNLALEIEHKHNIKKTELENSRSKLFATKENELIDRAKRDQEIEKIEDEKVKDQLKKEIEELRTQRNLLVHNKLGTPSILDLSEAEKEILMALKAFPESQILRDESFDGKRSFRIGKIEFGISNNKSFMKYEHALEMLCKKGLVRQVGTRGSYFEATHKGWELIDKLDK